ncbi:hypothetical protein VTN02DRAFT_4014 [Thermoascus thermophilus]
MPADIRSFFGGKSSQDSNASAAKTSVKKEDPSATRKRRSRKVVDDSEEEEEAPPVKAPAPKAKPAKEQKVEPAQGEPTTTSAYFASTKKRGRPPKVKNTETTDIPEPPNGAPSHRKADKGTPKNKRTKEVDNPAEIRGETPSSVRKERSERNPAQETNKKVHTIDVEDNLGGDDNFAMEYRKLGRRDDDYVEDEDQSDFEELVVQPAVAASEDATRKKRASMPDGDEDMVLEDVSKASKNSKVSPTKNGRKRKSEALLDKDEDSESYEDTKKPAERKTSSTPAPKKQKATPTKKDRPESKEIQDIFDSIPTVRPPTPPPPSGEPRKFNFANQAQRSQPPPGAGTKEIPVGAENCLAGLSFVFTGILETLGREEGQSLVKRYGGKVTTAPSSKTSYVVLGSDAGPKKLETIKKFNLKTINEDGLFELIRRLPANGGDGKAAEKYEEKKKAEEKKIREMAAEIDREEKQKAKAIGSLGANAPKGTEMTPSGSQGPRTDDRLWTTKYAPTSINMICGNKGVVEKLQFWLRNWRKNAKLNFSRPGKDGSGTYRAVMLHGPPGIGKTTAAHLVAKIEGFDIVETNASDTRSKKLVESGLLGVLDTTSLQGYFSGEGKKVESEKKNLVLIMDEVDGMSAGDRGGVGALAAVAKKTRIPLILICNDRRLPKMKPFDHVTYDLPFRRPTAEQIRARLSTICFREGLKIPPQVLDGLIEGTHSDIRQVINMLSTVKLDQQQLDYDKGKEMSKAWEKHVILKPWDIVSKILSAQMFSPSSKSTLNDKIELYFNDHEFSYLMLQENYLKTNPTLASGYQGKERSLKLLELADKAASSISDGDLVDSMIHGSQQQWSLMPTHAAFSFVRPASFMSGNMIDRPAFASWLGQNSKQGKLARYVKEIQGHMRLRSIGDRDEIRQQYFPVLWNKLIRRLMDEGKDSVEDVIDLMDSYFLTREDWDAMVELGLGPMDESNVKIDSQTKATFTRLYNQRSHPLPFMKASSVVAPKKMPKVKPDIEDAIEESDEEEELLEGEARQEDESEELDLKKDKYVKVPKKPAAQKGGAGKGKKTAKASKANDDDFIDDDEEEKPKKRGRKPKAKA